MWHSKTHGCVLYAYIGPMLSTVTGRIANEQPHSVFMDAFCGTIMAAHSLIDDQPPFRIKTRAQKDLWDIALGCSRSNLPAAGLDFSSQRYGHSHSMVLQVVSLIMFYPASAIFTERILRKDGTICERFSRISSSKSSSTKTKRWHYFCPPTICRAIICIIHMDPLSGSSLLIPSVDM